MVNKQDSQHEQPVLLLPSRVQDYARACQPDEGRRHAPADHRARLDERLTHLRTGREQDDPRQQPQPAAQHRQPGQESVLRTARRFHAPQQPQAGARPSGNHPQHCQVQNEQPARQQQAKPRQSKQDSGQQTDPACEAG